MTDFLRDLRLAVGQFGKRPGISALAVLSLGLGIGVNSAIFSIVNAVLLKDMPATDPQRVVEVYVSDAAGFLYGPSSFPDYRDYVDQNDTLSGLAAYSLQIATHDTGEEMKLRFGEIVTGNYFDLLGVSAAAGRFFLPEEDAISGTHPVVVLGYRFWMEWFGGARDAVGKSLELNGLSFTIVGVAPERMRGSFPGIVADFWIPVQMSDAFFRFRKLDDRGSRLFFLKGRLKSGVSLDTAQAELRTLSRRLARAYPETNEGREVLVVPIEEVLINPGIDGPVVGVAGLLMIIVGLVLLIACANIANLLLAQAADRRKDIAICVALGASRFRVIREMLTESLVFAVMGTLCSGLFAYWTMRLVVGFRPPLSFPISFDMGLDTRVLGFTLAVALMTGMACGLAPALSSSRPELVPALKDVPGSGGAAARRLGVRNLLVVSQVAVSMVLLVGAGLFARSLANAQSIDPGFTLRKGVVVQLALSLSKRHDDDAVKPFYRELTDRLRGLPGVRSVAITEQLPLGFSMQTKRVEIEGQEIEEERNWPQIDSGGVGPNYFETMGIGIPWGRGFSIADGEESRPVVVVNETMATAFWPGEDPLGKRLRFEKGGAWYEVVGVTQNGKYRSLGEEPRPYVYRAFYQESPSYATVVVAADGDEAATLNNVRKEMDALDPDLPIYDQRTMSEHLSIMIFPAMMGAGLLLAFGALGLVLASVGIYGVVAYSVSRRTREVGIRVALGARPHDVVGLVVREGMTPVFAGLVLGTLLAWIAGGFLESYLYSLSPWDPVTLIVVLLVLSAVSFLANLIPAQRAIRVDPVTALRNE